MPNLIKPCFPLQIESLYLLTRIDFINVWVTDADKLVKEGVHTTQFLGFFVADCYHFYFLLATSLCVVSIFQFKEVT